MNEWRWWLSASGKLLWLWIIAVHLCFLHCSLPQIFGIGEWESLHFLSEIGVLNSESFNLERWNKIRRMDGPLIRWLRMAVQNISGWLVCLLVFFSTPSGTYPSMDTGEVPSHPRWEASCLGPAISFVDDIWKWFIRVPHPRVSAT